MKMRDFITIVESAVSAEQDPIAALVPTIDIVPAGKTMRLINLNGERAGSFQYGSRDVFKGFNTYGKQASWSAKFRFDGIELDVGPTNGVKQMKPKVEAAIRRYLAQKNAPTQD